MPKTGLKTFVYSFSISLLMIFSLDRVFGRTLHSTPQSIEIPSKNIMLFIRGEQADPSSRPAPVKKIALRVLPEIPPAAADSSGEEIIMADNSPGDFFPESSLFLEDLTAEPAESYVLAAQSEPEPITETKQIVYEPEPKPEQERKPEPLPLKQAVQQPAARAAENITIPLEKPAAATFAGKTLLIGKNLPLKVEDDILPAENASEVQPKMMVAVREENTRRLVPLQKSRDELAGLGKNIRITDAREPNQVALADGSVPIKSMTEENAAKIDNEKLVPKEKWQKMADKPKVSDSPWVVAKGAVKPQNSMVAQEVYYQKDNQQIKNALNDVSQNNGDGIQLASETVKNLLIPIPEDILNDENLTPQLVSPSRAENHQKEAELEAELRHKKELEAAQKQKKDNEDTQKAQQEKLLTSLSSIFSSKDKKGTEAAEEGLVETIKKKIKQSPSHGKIIPTEMRLSFQPNRAEISGQTLRWIQAFAAKTATEADMAIEIRIDGTGAMDLQQKRLNLLHNILTNKGVEYSKINTVFTTREPNSFIIRTVKLNIADNFNTGSTNGNIRKASDGYYLQW